MSDMIVDIGYEKIDGVKNMSNDGDLWSMVYGGEPWEPVCVLGVGEEWEYLPHIMVVG